MIEQLADFPSNVVGFVCKGRVTKSDYDAVLVPAVLNALRTHDKVRLYYETDTDFAGFDLGAAWEDFKIGMKHFTRWDRVAVVTDIEWIKHVTRFFGFLMPATMVKLFSRSDATLARDWIRAN
jgi:SpoIIAA-like